MPKLRPDPEKLLHRVEEQERHRLRGKLKIYLGAAPGVGKTYTMLEEALTKRNQGVDVMVGVIESHGRQEIEFLLEDFTVLPRQVIEYRGQQLTEFDLDAALKRNPALILIDEMAHTNAPGLRHSKRWQDIKELLDRGIDVYATLNVQHIESLNDTVSQIVHTLIKETVPDKMIELADTIELIDLPPEDLLKRLQEGKVYIPQQASIAAEHFFRAGNLSALRELALRVTAERVEAQVLLYRQDRGIKHVWPTKERLLVCVSSRARSTKLIRTAKRMASRLKAEWTALHIDRLQINISEQERIAAIQNLQLAERLGAPSVTLTGRHVAEEIINFARENNITRIIIGKRLRPRWQDIIFGSLADKVIRLSGEIDVYLITEEFDTAAPAPVTARGIPWRGYGTGLLIAGVMTLINSGVQPYIDTAGLSLLYLFGVAGVAWLTQLGPVMLASVLSVFAYYYVFVTALSGPLVPGHRDFLTLFLLWGAMQLVSYWVLTSRWQMKSVRQTERHTAALYKLTRQLATTRGVDALLTAAVQYIGELFDGEVMALLPDGSQMVVQACYPKKISLNDKEQSIARWVFDLGQMAGLGTDTLPVTDSIFIPLLASLETIGVLKVRPIQAGHSLTPEQIRLLETCANQVALAIEVDRTHR